MGRRALRKIDPQLDLSFHLRSVEDLPAELEVTTLFGSVAPLEVEIGSGKGLFLVSCGFSGIVMLVLLLFASTGSYAATDFLFSSFTAPFFLIFSTFGLMFNDLVFLRNRVKRAWANTFDFLPPPLAESAEICWSSCL